MGVVAIVVVMRMIVMAFFLVIMAFVVVMIVMAFFLVIMAFVVVMIVMAFVLTKDRSLSVRELQHTVYL